MGEKVTISDDVYALAKVKADAQKMTVDAFISDLIRRHLDVGEPEAFRSQFRLLRKRSGTVRVTPEIVKELDESGY